MAKQPTSNKTTDRTAERVQVTCSTGNVFADLGFENPREELAKAQIVSAIASTVKRTGFTQTKVAELLSLDQPSVSKLLRGRTGGFSLERLLSILTLLDQDVEIRVYPRPADEKREARLTVDIAAAS